MVCRFRALLRSFRVRICPNLPFAYSFLGTGIGMRNSSEPLLAASSGSVLALESVDEVLDLLGRFPMQTCAGASEQICVVAGRDLNPPLRFRVCCALLTQTFVTLRVKGNSQSGSLHESRRFTQFSCPKLSEVPTGKNLTLGILTTWALSICRLLTISVLYAIENLYLRELAVLSINLRCIAPLIQNLSS